MGAALRAAGLRAVERFFAGDFLAVDAAPIFAAVFLRAAGFLRVAVFLRAAGFFAALRLVPRCGIPGRSSAHLPDITRCAASATASAISAPNLVALDIMLDAALEAVSAASMPASRMALRALGLAAIAAAAAVSPAASISLLIAALAILSTVLLFFDFAGLRVFGLAFDGDFLVAVLMVRLVVVFAMNSLPVAQERTLQNRNKIPNARCGAQKPDMLKGTAAQQRCPSTWSAEGGANHSPAPSAYERPPPTSLLNHETSDHLLSLRDCEYHDESDWPHFQDLK
ncbi:MAG: hypothetical protein H0W71_00710 [Sphingomonas sp.]|nr:hypothetical protein [Sphingomonas sp.]